MDRKSTLLNLVQKAYQIEQAFVRDLTEHQRNQTGSNENWSAKDLVAHNAAWKQRHTENVLAVQRGEAGTQIDNYDHENEKVYMENRERSWEEVLQNAKDVQQMLTQVVSDLPLETLEKQGYFHWQAERPLWRSIYGYGFAHPIVHLAEHDRNRGEKQQAANLIKQLVEAMQSLAAGTGADWQGGIQYNLACYHALSGEIEAGITELRKALEINPDFREWVEQDQDLEALRAHPKYPALLETHSGA